MPSKKMATRLKIPDGVTYRRVWIAVSKFGYPLWDVWSDYKDFARKSAAKARGSRWEDLEREGWTLIKAWLIWEPGRRAKEENDDQA